MKEQNTEIAIVGSGIVGLALAYQFARRGNKVTVFERNEKPVGASIRNFGMVWPIGQPAGVLLDRAMDSRASWLCLAEKAGFWYSQKGSLHLAYHEDEWEVLQEFYASNHDEPYQIHLLKPDECESKSPFIQKQGLKGGLWSSTEVIVDPREAIWKISDYLAETYQVNFRRGEVVVDIAYPHLITAQSEWQAEQIYVCNGADFETLYPQIYAESGITKCKLQMLRSSPLLKGGELGASICGGLTLTHYKAFQHCQTLSTLKQRIQETMPEYIQWGIHVMITQNGLGELVIGDTHQYGLNPLPFDSEYANNLIINYLKTFTQLPEYTIGERWHGVYAKLADKTEFIASPEPNVTIVNGLGGAGMTLSFGLAKEIVSHQTQLDFK
jgi:D-hydroxyproline dehydrogenase subunit beta